MLALPPQHVAAFDMSAVEPLRVHDSVFDNISPSGPDFGLFFDARMSERQLPTSTPTSYSSTMTPLESGVDPRMLSYPGQSQGESNQPKKSLKRKASPDLDDESVERPSKRTSYAGLPAPDYRDTPVMAGGTQPTSRASLPPSSHPGYHLRTESTGYVERNPSMYSTPYSEAGEFLAPAQTSPMPLHNDRAWTLSPGMIASPAPFNTTPVTTGYTTPSSGSYAPTQASAPVENTSSTFPPIFRNPNRNANLPSLSAAAGGDKPSPVKPPNAKPRCWEHGCNGRTFSTFSNLLRHQRERSGISQKTTCPRCGAEFTRSTARNMHLQNAKCKGRRHSSFQ